MQKIPNVKEVSKRNHINVINVRRSTKTIQQVQAIAEKLSRQFNSQKDFGFFCKCAWHLSEDEVWTIAGAAMSPTVKSPIRYFTAACRNQLKLRGV